MFVKIYTTNTEKKKEVFDNITKTLKGKDFIKDVDYKLSTSTLECTFVGSYGTMTSSNTIAFVNTMRDIAKEQNIPFEHFTFKI